jgi:cytochrome c oxidase subunit 2
MLISFFFSLVVVFMVYAIFAFRKRNWDDAEGEHFHGNAILEIVWTVVPLIVVIVFAFIGVSSLANVTRAEENELVVKVQGFQWAWSFEYPQGFASAELVLPVNQPARMEMTATDVLHSFWVPEFRLKQDLVPGQTTELRFTPIQVGEYKVRCAELCGLTHWNMETPVRVLTQEEYDRWLQEKTAGITPALAEAANQKGE